MKVHAFQLQLLIFPPPEENDPEVTKTTPSICSCSLCQNFEAIMVGEVYPLLPLHSCPRRQQTGLPASLHLSGWASRRILLASSTGTVVEVCTSGVLIDSSDVRAEVADELAKATGVYVNCRAGSKRRTLNTDASVRADQRREERHRGSGTLTPTDGLFLRKAAEWASRWSSHIMGGCVVTLSLDRRTSLGHRSRQIKRIIVSELSTGFFQKQKYQASLCVTSVYVLMRVHPEGHVSPAATNSKQLFHGRSYVEVPPDAFPTFWTVCFLFICSWQLTAPTVSLINELLPTPCLSLSSVAGYIYGSRLNENTPRSSSTSNLPVEVEITSLKMFPNDTNRERWPRSVSSELKLPLRVKGTRWLTLSRNANFSRHYK